MRKVKGDYSRHFPKLNLEQAYARRGKANADGVERPQPAPAKTGKPIRPEDIPGYAPAKPPQE